MCIKQAASLSLLIVTHTSVVLANDINKCEKELEPIERIAPEYPGSPVFQELEGFVMVDFVVDEEGIPTDIHVTESSHVRFNQSALLAISKWRYLERKEKCQHHQKLIYKIEHD